MASSMFLQLEEGIWRAEAAPSKTVPLSRPTSWGFMVPERGLEPPLPCENQLLKLARLPIPPLGHKRGKTRHFDCARRIRLCQRAAPHVILQIFFQAIPLMMDGRKRRSS
jgi:hypothetical protein